MKRVTHDSVPASVGHLKEVRNELLSGMDAKFKKVDGQFKEMGARIDKVLEVVLHAESMSHRTLALMEEQRSENRIVC